MLYRSDGYRNPVISIEMLVFGRVSGQGMDWRFEDDLHYNLGDNANTTYAIYFSEIHGRYRV